MSFKAIDIHPHVISTDVPDVPEDYVHRIGRTGRAGATGDAFILVSRDEEGSLARIERQVGQRLPRVTLPDFDYTPAPPPAAADARPGRAQGRQAPKSRAQQRPGGGGQPKGAPGGPNRPGGRR